MKQVKYTPHTEQPFEYDEIKKCPCCGSDVEGYFTGNAYTKSRSFVIKCLSCRLKREDAAIRQSSEWVAKVCIDHWNKRT